MKRLSLSFALLGALAAGALAQDKRPTLHEVGYAHLDTQWRWTFPQVIREYLHDTLVDNFKLFDKYPNYIFNFTGANRYRLMKEYWPAEYAKMKDYVAKGRWFPAGSSMEEGDVNSPGLESLIRQVLYGNRYFRKEFGKASEEYMLPDCFGFPAALPSILAHCGVKGFSTQKLTWGSAVGIPFHVGVWEGPDGNGIIAALDAGNYVARIREDVTQNKNWLARIKANGDRSGAYVDYNYYGTGDRGGAPDEESVQWLERSLKGDGHVRVISAEADRMFKEIPAESIPKLPRYKGDLLLTEHSAGSLTSQAMIKRWNRWNENLAEVAEATAAAADWFGSIPYPGDRLRDAWTLMLGCQFHDTMAGTALPKAYEYAWNDELLAMNQFAQVATQSVSSLGPAFDFSGTGTPLVIYNPVAHERTDYVEIEMPWRIAAIPEGFSTIWADGSVHPAQILSLKYEKARLLIEAHAPSMGFEVLRVVPAPAAASHIRATNRTLENGSLTVKVNESGDVSSIFDRNLGKEMLRAPIRLAFQHENPRDYPAWNMDWTDQREPASGFVDGPATIRLKENGPLRATIEVEQFARGSRFVREYRLYLNSRRLEFHDSIDWKTPSVALKATFPLTISNPLATYGEQIGAVMRGNNEPKKYEVPSHRWFDLSNPSNGSGVSILTAAKFGSDKPDDSTLRLTLLYTPGTRGGYQDQGTQDWGHHEIDYALQPHTNTWRHEAIPTSALEFDRPLVAFIAPKSGVDRGKRSLTLGDPHNKSVSVVALKRAEDGPGWIVRMKNETDLPAAFRFTGASEIISADEVDGQERKLRTANLAGGAITGTLQKYGVRAFRFGLAGSGRKMPRVKSTPVALDFNADVVSSNDLRGAGSFESGLALPAEQLPKTIDVASARLSLGPTDGAKLNAVVALGQKITLPGKLGDTVMVLAARDDRDEDSPWPAQGTVHAWRGPIGQWDNRHWAGQVPELAYSWSNKMVGIAPAFLRNAPVAWWSTHTHSANGDNPYDFAYLFHYELKSRGELQLPNDPHLKILAVTVLQNYPAQMQAATPLMDRLDRTLGVPTIRVVDGKPGDTQIVSIEPPILGLDDQLRYTLDGSEPGARSMAYKGPISIASPTTLAARIIDASGVFGPVAKLRVETTDNTPPSIVSVQAWPEAGVARIRMSEPVDWSQASAGFDRLPAQISPDPIDPREALITSSARVQSGAVLVLTNVVDRSPKRNRVQSLSGKLSIEAPLLSVDRVDCGRGASERPLGTSIGPGSPWSLAFKFITPVKLAPRTLIAGLGSGRQDEGGSQRFVANFPAGLHFWGHNVDLAAKVQIEPNRWYSVAATYDGGTLKFFVDGKLAVEETVELSDCRPIARFGPVDAWDETRRFTGQIRDFQVWPTCLPPSVVAFVAKRANP